LRISVKWCDRAAGIERQEGHVQVTIAKPIKTAGRVVLGPRLVGQQYARIVSVADGSGRIEVFDKAAGLWCAALESCGFCELWSAAALPLTFSTRTPVDILSD
jgi:hypothetical protein